MTKKFSLSETLPGWGWVGFSNKLVEIANVSASSVTMGVERECNPGERYSSPVAGVQLELSEGLPVPLFSPLREEAGRTWLRMRLEADPPFSFSSLYQLSCQLREKDAENRVEFEQLLGDLDHLFELLAEAFEAVHRHGVGVGLVDPKNVLYYFDKEEQMRLVLPDLFFWNQSIGDPPRFISSRSEFIGLWLDAHLADDLSETLESERDQIDYIDRYLAESQQDTSRDVRALARLIAWSVTGECGAVGSVSRDRLGDIWPVLRRADGESEEGAITSPSKLGYAIRGLSKRPSSVIRVEPPKAGWAVPRPSIKQLSVALLLLCLALLVPVLSHFSIEIPRPPKPPQKYSLCEECDASSKVHSVLRSQQVPLIAQYLEVYGDDPFPQQSPESSNSKKLFGQAITQTLLQTQASVLSKQVEIVDELYAELSGVSEPQSAELICLGNEAARIEKALGTHIHVLWVQTDPAVNELPDPVSLVSAANNILVSLRAKPYYRDTGEQPWDQEFLELLQLTGVTSH